jgi:hypothetical protein
LFQDQWRVIVKEAKVHHGLQCLRRRRKKKKKENKRRSGNDGGGSSN